MGCKKFYSFIAIAFTLFFPVTVMASTTEDLYRLYSLPFTLEMDKEAASVINQYENTKRYVYTYQTLSNMDSSEALFNDMFDYKQKIIEAEFGIMNGFNKSLDDIYNLEQQYSEATTKYFEKLNRLCQIRNSKADDAVALQKPSQDAYQAAIVERDKARERLNIGELLHEPPLKAFFLDYHSEEYTAYLIQPQGEIQVVFDGTIKSIYEDEIFGKTVIIDSGNGINMYYCNLDSVNMSEGSSVKQFDVLGTSKDKLAVYRLRLNDEFVDLTKLFDKERS